MRRGRCNNKGAHLGAEKHKLVTGLQACCRLWAGRETARPSHASLGETRVVTLPAPSKGGIWRPGVSLPGRAVAAHKDRALSAPRCLHCGHLPAFTASERPAAESPREKDGSCNQENDPMAAQSPKLYGLVLHVPNRQVSFPQIGRLLAPTFGKISVWKSSPAPVAWHVGLTTGVVEVNCHSVAATVAPKVRNGCLASWAPR
ncbi:hypothetical protein VTG60DRAFT_456 [Thermothelomyces hinnuleus]